jgi:hypothetical protein
MKLIAPDEVTVPVVLSTVTNVPFATVNWIIKLSDPPETSVPLALPVYVLLNWLTPPGVVVIHVPLPPEEELLHVPDIVPV